MKDYFDKLIVERPRRGSRWNSDDPKGYARRRYGKDCDIEDLPSKESMSGRRKHGYDAKELNEFLAPLKRFLGKNVGRPWDKVHSEICEQIKLTSTVQRHILEHLYQYVEVNAVLHEGKVCVLQPYGYGLNKGYEPIEETSTLYYVCPKSKILKKNKPKRTKAYWKSLSKVDPAERMLAVSEKLQFHKLDGVWYAVDLAPLPAKVKNTRKHFVGVEMREVAVWERPSYSDEVFRSHNVGIPWHSGTTAEKKAIYFYGAEVYAVKKRQANSKELKRHGLKNDPQ